MNKKILQLMIALLLMLGLVSCTVDSRLNMKFTPKVGDVYHINIIMDQEIKQTVSGQDSTINQKLGFGFSLTAREADEAGNTWVDVKYEWVQLDQKSDMGNVVYDSRNPTNEDNPLATGFKVLVGKGYSMKISPDGEVLEVTGIDTMISDILKEIGVTDEQLIAQMEQQFKEKYSTDSLKEQAGNMVINFPDEPIEIGDSWTSTVSSSSLVPVNVETTYTLTSYENELATVNVVSVISQDAEGAETNLGPYKVRYNLSGTQEGTITVDTKTGWSVNSTIDQAIAGDMTMIINDQEILVPMSITSHVTVEMIGQ